MQHVLDCLEQRGLIEQLTSPELRGHLLQQRKVFLGIDPTADSLHLGHLLGIIVLAWFQKFGHQTVTMVGGATALIGDPSGKSQERPFLENKVLEQNTIKLFSQIKHLLLSEKGKDSSLFLNNLDWLGNYKMLDFLREVGKHFRVGVMLSKESVKNRLSSEEGLSFTEFSYQLLQAYDFYYLQNQHQVTLQIGGSDQWGNIVAGIELMRKKGKKESFGLTFPLLTRSDGKKFGKSEEGAVWLSADYLSPYDFYQYLYRIPDADVILMLQRLTFLPLAEIQDIQNQMKDPHYIPNTAQKILAREVTHFVHQEKGLSQALKVTENLTPGFATQLTTEVLEQIAQENSGPSLALSEVIGEKFSEIARKVGLVSSKSEAQRLIEQGGAYLNNQRVDDIHTTVKIHDIIGEKYLLLGSGKKKKVLITIEK